MTRCLRLRSGDNLFLAPSHAIGRIAPPDALVATSPRRVLDARRLRAGTSERRAEYPMAVEWLMDGVRTFAVIIFDEVQGLIEVEDAALVSLPGVAALDALFDGAWYDHDIRRFLFRIRVDRAASFRVRRRRALALRPFRRETT